MTLLFVQETVGNLNTLGSPNDPIPPQLYLFKVVPTVVYTTPLVAVCFLVVPVIFKH